MTVVLVALGGAAGAASRYVVDSWVSDRVASAFPWGTFVINVSGSFVLGFLFGLAVERDVLSADIRAPVMVGFIGAYTTFSTWMIESWRLLESGSTGLAVANLFGSMGLGVLALVLGLVLGRTLP